MLLKLYLVYCQKLLVPVAVVIYLIPTSIVSRLNFALCYMRMRTNPQTAFVLNSGSTYAIRLAKAKGVVHCCRKLVGYHKDYVLPRC